MDLAAYFLLIVLIVMGCWMASGHNLATDAPYNCRDSIGEWWRSRFHLSRRRSTAARAPIR